MSYRPPLMPTPMAAQDPGKGASKPLLLDHSGDLMNPSDSVSPTDAVPPGDSMATTLPPILTVDELAQALRINRKTTYEALARGEIPGVRRIGRTYRIHRDAVLQWLRGQARVSRKRSQP